MWGQIPLPLLHFRIRMQHLVSLIDSNILERQVGDIQSVNKTTRTAGSTDKESTALRWLGDLLNNWRTLLTPVSLQRASGADLHTLLKCFGYKISRCIKSWGNACTNYFVYHFTWTGIDSGRLQHALVETFRTQLTLGSGRGRSSLSTATRGQLKVRFDLIILTCGAILI